MDDKKIIEVGGMKLEVDLRYARQVETFRIGDNVKVLIKEYGDSFKSHPGVIVGFDNFKQRPTIIIAYLKQEYSSAEIRFLYLNEDSKDVEICPMVEETIIIEKETVVEQLNSQISRAEAELAALKEKRAYFLENFGKYFEKQE